MIDFMRFSLNNIGTLRYTTVKVGCMRREMRSFILHAVFSSTFSLPLRLRKQQAALLNFHISHFLSFRYLMDGFILSPRHRVLFLLYVFLFLRFPFLPFFSWHALLYSLQPDALTLPYSLCLHFKVQ